MDSDRWRVRHETGERERYDMQACGIKQGAPQVLTCITGVAHSTVTLLNTLVDMFPTCLLKSSVLTCLMKLFYI